MNSIGNKIRELRTSKGYTLKDVAEKTNLTTSFLSQLERSKTSVTLQSLSKISKALGVTQSYFFAPEEAEKEKQVVRYKSHQDVEMHGTNFVYQSLSGNLINQLFDPMLVVLLPDDKQKRVPSVHEGQEFIYVLEGQLQLLFEDNVSVLKPGDSFHIDSTTPHTWYNATSGVVRLLYVSSKPF